MKDVLNSVDMRMLRKGDNVPNARSLPGKNHHNTDCILVAIRQPLER